MLTVEMTLLGGRYRATNFEDRRRVEWPPEPARLYYAAVDAVFREDHADANELELLRKWESLPAPAITCSDRADDGRSDAWSIRDVVDHYVPGNFASSWTRDIQPQWAEIARLEADSVEPMSDRESAKLARDLEKRRQKLRTDSVRVTQPTGAESAKVIASVIELLPDNRNKQARTFPVVRPDDSQIYFCWDNSGFDDTDRKTLDAILARIARVGHSSSVVSCRVVEDQRPPTWVPADPRRRATGLDLRTTTSGLLDALVAEFARHQGRTGRVMPAMITRYVRAGEEVRERSVQQSESGDWIILRFQRNRQLALSRTADITRSVRAALIAHAEEPVRPVISGHQASGGEVDDLRGPHISVLVLPNVSHVHSDGLIHAVAIGLPASAAHEDRAAVSAALDRWSDGGSAFDLTLPGGTYRRLEPAVLERAVLDVDRRPRRVAVASRQFWSRTADSWSSVTPVALDRHPRIGRRPDYDELHAAVAPIVAAMCRRSGLPEPTDVTASPGSIWATVPPVAVGRSGGRAAFPQYAVGADPRNRRFTTHVTIRFDEEVAGPIVLGAGRYFGYGLMLPTPGVRRGEGR